MENTEINKPPKIAVSGASPEFCRLVITFPVTDDLDIMRIKHAVKEVIKDIDKAIFTLSMTNLPIPLPG